MKMNFIFLHLFLLATVTTLVESGRPKFRPDYRYEKVFKSFYKLHHTGAAWEDARLRCEAEGAELMVPETLDEADAMPMLITNIIYSYEGVFIGMHDLYAERTFITVNGKPLTHTILELLWENREPMNGHGRCVAMRRTGRFYVQPCHRTMPFLCKVKDSQVTYHQECDTFEPRWKPGPNGTCYISHQEPQRWSLAYATCLAAGGHLAILNSRAEADYIRDLFKQIPERRMPDNQFAFLGFSDLFQRHHYRTILGDRLEEAGYNDWDFTNKCAELNDNSGRERRCGGLRRGGLLATADCNTPASFFCEKPPKEAVVVADVRTLFLTYNNSVANIVRNKTDFIDDFL